MKYGVVTLVLFWAGISTLTQAQNLANPGFEEGPGTGWLIYSSNGAGLIGTADFFSSSSITPAVTPRTGQYMARLGGFGYAENAIAQTITLPSTSNVYLHVYYQDRAPSNSECSGVYVGARIRVSIANQILLDTYLCDYNVVTNWTHIYFDLSAASGQTVDVVFRADAANSVWSYLYLDDFVVNSSITNVEDAEALPVDFSLSQNYPNPFNPSTTIKYELPFSSKIKLEVFNVSGQLEATIVNATQKRGTYSVEFNASEKPSGVYFYRLTAVDESGNVTVRNLKMLLLK